MIFNSIDFLIFFAIVFSFYHIILKEKTLLQNILLLVASYVFYAWVTWKILPLLAAATAVFYFLGIAVFKAKTDKHKQFLTITGVVLGIGALLYFKYFNFFITSFKDLFESFGLHTNLHTFKIIVPIGISFFTFRLLSYIIDIHRGRIEPTRDFIAYAVYVAFFPCLLAGPIDRPALLIPQLKNRRTFDYALAVDGMRQILWGLFKKIIIADGCAIYVDAVFNGDFQWQRASTLVLAAIFYSFQMYADFSGYSDMAIGTAKLLGFRVTKNFDYPYFAQNIAEFWRKWHISLTSWLTDYVFMPLNVKFRDWGKWGMIVAIMINFLLCGLWHGDSWTFVLWGFYHGLLFIPLILSGKMFKKSKLETYSWGFPKPRTLFNIMLTFALVTAGLIIFRAESLNHAFNYLMNVFDKSLLRNPWKMERAYYIPMFFNLAVMFSVEWFQRRKQHALENGLFSNRYIRWMVYFILFFLIYWFRNENQQQFIYFQF